MTSLQRRHFLKTAALSAFAGPNILRAQNSKQKIRVACVGIGQMGAGAVQASSDEEIVAFCDVDWRKLSDRSAIAIAEKQPKVPRFTDFREMLDKKGKDIDAVLISTPDHTHFAVAMAAMQAGKHIFVQKPLAHNIWQVRTLQKAAKKYGVQTVMGNQGHCWEGIRLVKEWFEAGVLGEVREVHCWTDRPAGKVGFPETLPTEVPAGEPVPKEVSWDLWQGPVAEREFSSKYMPMFWRGWWDYGCGGLGDIGCHCLDAPFWALQLGMPEKVEVIEQEPGVLKSYTAGKSHIVFHFAARGSLPAVKIHWYEGGLLPEALPGMEKGLPGNGMIMKGSKETLFSDGMRVQSPQLWPRERMKEHYEVLRRKPLPRSAAGEPIGELFDAIRGEIPHAGSHFDYACPLTELVNVGVLAIRSGKTLEWDAEAMKVKGAPEFDNWIKEPVRDGWSYGEDLWTA
ncbi:Predicted dehydrogenase [Prosthecobacter debontii]|uniref:Predicted dehydrogenase n=1 Tax=Prosthecobacter debontii TaxID=48467 RepID=A0A1T4Y482_9BACT|nr:Gfo/Idh/MocA family oxidoreductase [Prosthecobacter debontii]SKA96546.1 Predicted dehydrogenase [Prosthecobacter debontii]